MSAALDPIRSGQSFIQHIHIHMDFVPLHAVSPVAVRKYPVLTLEMMYSALSPDPETSATCQSALVDGLLPRPLVLWTKSAVGQLFFDDVKGRVPGVCVYGARRDRGTH